MGTYQQSLMVSFFDGTARGGLGNLSLMAFERRLDRLNFRCDNYANA